MNKRINSLKRLFKAILTSLKVVWKAAPGLFLVRLLNEIVLAVLPSVVAYLFAEVIDRSVEAINGAPVEIEKADFGFMAIPIPANKNCEIRFTYRTPGFVTGTAISLAAAVMFAVYMVSLLLFRLTIRRRRIH